MDSNPIEIIVNGESRTVPGEWTVKDLLEQMVQMRGPVAVELNRQILKRTDWPLYHLHTADRLEIVQFVGGG